MSVGFAKKIGMTRLFLEGKNTPVTVLQFEPNYVLQLKTIDKDGYNAVQVGSTKQKKVTQAALGHIKKILPEADHGFRNIAEFVLDNIAEDKREFGINDFSINDLLDITGTTIGRGYTGAMKRWGFHGQPQTHGHDHVRAVGSTGSRWPQRITKGKKMAGHHGAKGLTLKKNLLVAIDEEKSLMFVKGSLPGANSSFVRVQKVK